MTQDGKFEDGKYPSDFPRDAIQKIRIPGNLPSSGIFVPRVSWQTGFGPMFSLVPVSCNH